VDKASLGQIFTEYFGIPCHSFHRLLHDHHHHHQLSGTGTTGQIVTYAPRGLSLKSTPRNKKKKENKLWTIATCTTFWMPCIIHRELLFYKNRINKPIYHPKPRLWSHVTAVGVKSGIAWQLMSGSWQDWSIIGLEIGFMITALYHSNGTNCSALCLSSTGNSRTRQGRRGGVQGNGNENILKNNKKTELHGFSPRENYTDRATATCVRS
jgi:hypothetical protein